MAKVFRSATSDELAKLEQLAEDVKKIHELLKAMSHIKCSEWHALAALGLQVGVEIKIDMPHEKEFWRVVMTYAAYHSLQHEVDLINKTSSVIEYMVSSPSFHLPK